MSVQKIAVPLHRIWENASNIFCKVFIIADSVAQLVEQLTLNQWVEGSSPSGVTRQNIKMQKTSEISWISEVFRYLPPAFRRKRLKQRSQIANRISHLHTGNAHNRPTLRFSTYACSILRWSIHKRSEASTDCGSLALSVLNDC